MYGPLIAFWNTARLSIARLDDAASWHPLLPGGRRMICTSDVRIKSGSHSRAWTLSRWYLRPTLGTVHESQIVGS
jgi:hypothetical protein